MRVDAGRQSVQLLLMGRGPVCWLLVPVVQRAGDVSRARCSAVRRGAVRCVAVRWCCRLMPMRDATMARSSFLADPRGHRQTGAGVGGMGWQAVQALSGLAFLSLGASSRLRLARARRGDARADAKLVLAGLLAGWCFLRASGPSSTAGEAISVDICSNCHPFYTGKQRIVDTGGRVQRFRNRQARQGRQ